MTISYDSHYNNNINNINYSNRLNKSDRIIKERNISNHIKNILKNNYNNIYNGQNVDNLNMNDVLYRFSEFLEMNIHEEANKNMKSLASRCDKYKKKIEKLELEIQNLHRRLDESPMQCCQVQSSFVQTKCCVCMTNPNNYINMSCGHMSVCGECHPRLDSKCPICRSEGMFMKAINSGVQ